MCSPHATTHPAGPRQATHVCVSLHRLLQGTSFLLHPCVPLVWVPSISMMVITYCLALEAQPPGRRAFMRGSAVLAASRTCASRRARANAVSCASTAARSSLLSAYPLRPTSTPWQHHAEGEVLYHPGQPARSDHICRETSTFTWATRQTRFGCGCASAPAHQNIWRTWKALDDVRRG